MKQPKDYATNTTTPAGRAEGQLTDDPGGGTGSGVIAEIDNDNLYAAIAPIQAYKDGGISDSDETTLASDMRDALEELTDRRVIDSAAPSNTLDEWDAGTTYSTAGELVTWKGFQFVAFNITGNLNKNPLLNPDFWQLIPKPDSLLMMFHQGKILPGGMSDMVDRAGGNFQQNIAFGRYRLGGNGDDFYNFFRVALDGTQVTSDATLEAIFGISGGNLYPFIDIFAPDVVGTRTLLDLGEYIATPQSVGGENDTLGEIQDDRLQGHWHDIESKSQATGASPFYRTGDLGTVIESNQVKDVADDPAHGTARTGDTTRPKEITEGAASIIIMQPV